MRDACWSVREQNLKSSMSMTFSSPTSKVPSAVVSGDYNFLINPFHSDFGKVKILQKEVFEFDRRLFIK
jgi:hypothetical protein